MRKCIQKLILLALMFVPGVMFAQNSSFSCNFDSDADRANWVLDHGTYTNKWIIDTAVNNGGTHSLYISHDDTTEHHYNPRGEVRLYAYKTIHLGIGTYNYSYDWLCNGESSFDYMRVALAPASATIIAGSDLGFGTSTIPQGWISLDNESKLNGETTWQTATGEAFVPATGDYKLVFYWRNDWAGGEQPPAAVDNISITLPACPKPVNLIASNIINDGFTISWTEIGTATSWSVTRCPAGEAPSVSNSYVENVNSPTITYTDLPASTPYDIYVQSNCSDEESGTAMITVRTACEVMTLPYRESFEDVANYEFDSCWFHLAGECYVAQNGYNDYTHHGIKSMSMSGGAMIASPYVPLMANQIALDFSYTSDFNGEGSLQIGFATSIDDLTTMIAVDTITPIEEGIFDAEIDFSSLDAYDGGYIIFKQINNASQVHDFYIDNIYIRQQLDCRRPASLRTTEISYNYTSLRWQPVVGANDYEVAYGLINNPDTIANNIEQHVYDTEITLTDLLSDTTYYIWVRSNCGDSYSEWRYGGTFHTQVSCAVMQNVAVTTSVNSIALAWEFDEHTGATATQTEVAWKSATETDFHTMVVDSRYHFITGLQSNTPYQIRLRTICDVDTSEAYQQEVTTDFNGVVVEGTTNSTNSHLPTDCYYRKSYTQMLYPSGDLIGVDTISSISFSVNNSRSASTRNWDIYMGHTTQSDLTARTALPLSDLTLVGENIPFTTEDGWNTISLTRQFVYHNDSNLVIAIFDSVDAYQSGISFDVHSGSALGMATDRGTINLAQPTGMTVYYSVPHIRIAAPESGMICDAPLMVASQITSTSVSLNWSAFNGGSPWQVEYKVANADSWITHAFDLVDTFTTISNLLPGTLYDIRVGSQCGGTLLYSNLQVYTECAAVNSPYTETFSQLTLNPCWTIGGMIGSSVPEINFYSLYLGYRAGGYAITSMFVDDLPSLHVTFKMKSAEEYAQLAILAGEDPDDWNTFVPVDTVTLTATNEYQSQDCNFYNYTGNGHYIAFQSLTNKIFIDSVVVEGAPQCMPPTDLRTSNVSSESATISWSGSNINTLQWLVTYGVQDSTERDTLQVPFNQFSCSISGLLANTIYEVMVYNVCTADTIASLSPLRFNTECGEISLPYVENFSTVTAGEYHPCWHTTGRHIYGWNNTEVPIIKYYTDDHENVLRFGDNVDMMTPLIPAPANSLIVSFDAVVLDDVHAGDIAVGFSTSSSDLSEAIYVDTIGFTNLRWNHFEVSFASLTTSEQGYVVFKNINNVPEYDPDFNTQLYYEGYLDNIVVDSDTDCPLVKDITVANITATSAQISFTDTTHTGAYTIGYSTINDATTITTTVDCATTTYTLTDLQSGVRYYVWVRTNCTSTSSRWSNGPSFVTDCEAISELPYSENFDSYTTDIAVSPTSPTNYPNHTLPTCWTFLNMSSSRSTYPQAYLCNARYSNDDYGDSATCLLFSSSYEEYLYAVLPSFTRPIDSLQIGFTYRNESVHTTNATLELGVMTDPSDTATFTLLATYPKSTTLTEVLHNFSIDHLSANATYHIAFRYGGSASSRCYLGIDNVVVEQAASCIIPESLVVSDILSNEATLSWSGYADNYNIQYRATTDSVWNDTTASDTTAITLIGLDSETEYEVRVQSDCNTSLSEWSRSLTFNTKCGAKAIPYVENFDDYTEDIATGSGKPSDYPNHAMPPCWNFSIEGSDVPQIFLTRLAAYCATGNALFFVSSDDKPAYAVLPQMAEPLGNIRISFFYRNENTRAVNSPVILGYVTDPTDYATFRPVDTFAVSEQFVLAEHDFDSDGTFSTDTTYYIAFRYGGSNGNRMYMSIDDIEVDAIPTCPKPSDLLATDIDATIASLSWSGSATSYEVQYRVTDASQWSLVSATGNTIILNGLTPTTEYEARVRAICTVGDTSRWSSAISFTTTCAPYELPYNEDFSTAQNTTAPECWNLYKGKLSNIQSGTDSLTHGGNWKFGSIRQINDGGINASIDLWNHVNGWLVTPSIHISTAATLEFDLARYDYYNDDTFSAQDQFSVLISSDRGATWSTLRSWNGTEFPTIPIWSDSAEHVAISLDAYLNDTIRIAFYGECNSAGDHYIHIDNIYAGVPTAVDCAVPTQLAVSNLDATSATLSWMGEANQYDVAYRPLGTDTWHNQTIATSILNITDLNPATDYEWRVRSHCDATASAWATGSFTTPAASDACATPTQIVAEVNEHTVTLDWQAPASQSQWEISLSSEGNDEHLQVANTHPISINHLTATTYTAKVRAICAEDNYSEWSEAIQFTIAEDVCDTIEQLSVSDIAAHSAIVSWFASDEQSAWEVRYGEHNFDYDEGTSVESHTHYQLLSNLSSHTHYDVYVRAICGEGFYSEWSHCFSFHTEQGQEGIDGVEGNYQFVIYPNPASGATTISLLGIEGKVVISIVDMNGRTINNESIVCGADCEKCLDVSGLAQGTYFVRVIGDNINSVRKLIIR